MKKENVISTSLVVTMESNTWLL